MKALKNILFTLLGMMLATSSLRGQTTKTVTLSFSTSDFQQQVRDNTMYISSDSLNVWYDDNTSEPALPYVRVNVLIPPDREYRSVSYTSTVQQVASQVQMATNPVLLPVGSTHQSPLPPPVIDRPRLIYPESNVVYEGTSYDTFYKIVSFKVYPFRYYQLGRSLHLLTNIYLSVSLDETEEIRYPSHYLIERKQEEIKARVKASVINGNELETLYGSIAYPLYAPPAPDDNTDYNFDYLIIAPKYFMFNGFDRLAQWKTTKGIRTKVLLLDSINSKYTGSTLQTRIKKAIKDYYVKSSGRLEYVLLAADVDKIPTLMCYGEVVAQGDTIRDYIPTDYYYSCLEDIDWDKNGNGIYGELSDSISLIPDVAVSRIPLNREDISEYIDRLLLYEQSPDTANWQNKMLLCANMGSVKFLINGTFVSDSHLKVDRHIYKEYKNYWDGEIWRLYDTYSDFQGGMDYNLNAYNLGYQLGNGYQIVYYKGHGDETRWYLEDSSYYGISHITYSTQVLPLIITEACSTNAFDYSAPCLGESFLKNKVLAYVGCSRENWYYLDSIRKDPSTRYSSSFFSQLLQDKENSLGIISKNVKKGLRFDLKLNPAMRWIVMGLNILGDTELPFYTVKPQGLGYVSISFDGEMLIVTTGADSCRICVSSLGDNGTSYFRIVENTNMASFTDLPESYTICVIRDGFIPYVVTYNVNTFIQNETIMETKSISSYNTYIGSNVTPLKPTGPVIIQGGKTKINSQNNVVITGEFEVKQGAEFEIRTQ